MCSLCQKNDTYGWQMEGTYREFLELLGVPNEHIIQIEKPTQFAVVAVLEISNDPGHYYTSAYVSIFDKIRENVGEGGGSMAMRRYTIPEEKREGYGTHRLEKRVSVNCLKRMAIELLRQSNLRLEGKSRL